MFCGRSRMPLVRIENSTTTAMSAMKMPFLPRSASTWLSRSVNLFSTGLMLPPTACESPVGGAWVGVWFDMMSPGGPRVARLAGLFHGHELEHRLGCGFGDGEFTGDATLGEGVHAIGDAEELGQLRRDHDDALALGGEPVDDRVDLVLRTDVDAAGGLVEDEHVGVGVDPLRQHDLLLVAARELPGLHEHARRLDVHRLAVLVGDRVLLVVVHEAVFLELLQ